MAFRNVYLGDAVRLYLGLPFYLIASIASRANETLLTTIRSVSNWHSVIMVYLGISRHADVRFRNGLRFRVGRKDLGRLMSLAELAALPGYVRREIGLRLEGEDATLRIKGKTLRLDLQVANAVAVELHTREHSMIDVKGRVVVDVGAYVDDTAIYYALHEGAKHVYAFEPFPYLYSMAVKNVRANHLENLITTLNAGVSGTSGVTSLDAGFTSFGKVESSRSQSRKGRIPVLSLDSVVKRFNIRHGALKVDCEGCEYGIFKNASGKAIRRFDLIHVEYHYGYRDIVERLSKEGFDVSHTKPAYNFSGLGSKAMLKGHIVAKRK